MNKSLGIALDDETDPQAPREVLIEILAAYYVRDGYKPYSQLLSIGWGIHQFDGNSEAFGDLQVNANAAILAGWLAREMSTTDLEHGWPWDPTRPVAGQYEEWLVKSSYVASHGNHVTEHGEDHASPCVSCATCGSPQPHLHPAVQHGGEVGVCPDPFHAQVTPQNTPAKIDAVSGRVPYAEDDLPIPLDMTPPGHVELEVIGGDEPPSGVELEVLTGDEPDATVAL